MSYKIAVVRFLLIGLCFLTIGIPLEDSGFTSQVLAQGGGDVAVDISFGDAPVEQNVGSYTDIAVQIRLANTAPSGDVIDVSLTLSASGGGEFPDQSEGTDFERVPDSNGQETRADRKLGSGNVRVLSTVFRPDSDAIGIYAITAGVSINGQLREDLSKSITFVLGIDRINALRAQMNEGEIASGVIEGELVGSSNTVSLMYLVANTSENDDEFAVTLETFTGVTFLGNETRLSSSWYLRKGELRVAQIPIQAHADALPGRYTVRLEVDSKNHPEVSFVKMLSVGFGPYKYAPPATSDVGSPQLNLYLNSIALPGVVSRSSGTTGDLHLWLENTSSTNEVRSLEVSVINGTEELIVLDSTGNPPVPDNFARIISNIQLGPQEGVLIIVQYRVPNTLSAGVYSFEIMARDPSSGAAEPLRIRQDVNLE